MGERALRELHEPRGSFALDVMHWTPFQVQYSCIADGLEAATGVSAGKLNLHLVQVPANELQTVVTDRKTAEELVFQLRPEFLNTYLNLSPKGSRHRRGMLQSCLTTGFLLPREFTGPSKHLHRRSWRSALVDAA